VRRRLANVSISGRTTAEATDTIGVNMVEHAVATVPIEEVTGRALDVRGNPTRSMGYRCAAVALALTLIPVVVDVAMHGTNGLGATSDAALVLVSAWAGVMMLRRYRADRRLEWLCFGVGALAWSLGQLAWIVQITWVGSTQWPSVADVGFMVWPIAAIGAVVVHTRPFDRSTRLMFIVDSLVLAVALSFITWELIVRAGVNHPERFSLLTQLAMLAYPLTDMVVTAMLVLLLLIDRSGARVWLLIGSIAIVVGDLASSAGTGSVGIKPTIMPFIGWAVGFGAIAVAASMPSGGKVGYTRAKLSRLLVVHVPVLAAIWVAAGRYLVGHEHATPVTTIIGVLSGMLLIGEQLAIWYHTSKLSGRLQDNIVNLRQTEAELRALLDDLPDSVVVVNARAEIVEANALALNTIGRSRAEVLGNTFGVLVRDDDRPRLVAAWNDLRNGVRLPSPVFPFDLPDGREIMLEGDVHVPIRDPDRVVVTLRDITGRVREAEDLDAAQERFRLAFHGAPTGMALSDADTGVLLDVNASLATMLGYERTDLIGRRMDHITHPDDAEVTSPSRHRDGAIAGSYHLERRYIRTDQSVMWARTWVTIMNEAGGESLAITHIEDITEQRHSAEQLEWAATHDGLTRLPNRFRFLDQLARYLETSEPGAVAVMFIDLDNFKVINDSLGHGVGDELLRGMSERLRAVVRDRDMLSRFGGDEFIVMLRDIEATMSPVEIAERLRAEIAIPLVVDGAELYVTASIGIAVADRPGVTTTELLRDADAAMYRAKARGRDCVEVFSPGTHDATVLTLRTNNELRRGLERGEVVPYYQPIVQLDSGHLVGFEVLARWRHPDRGLLGPEQFLPMAEETGLLGDVGAAVLQSSLTQLAQWRSRIPRFANLSVAVNVGGRQLMSLSFHTMVAEALAESGLTADALWLEITESTLMSDVKAATIALRELRSLGLHLAVDDFGTGYSSLTYLKRFPVESIKVDRSFVSGLGIDPEDTTIVEAVVKLGHSLGLLVVAEGVETPLQLARLREVGCDRGQGYVFGRPRPAELIETEFALS
jgi:diguanylate cyclase (GGDEF)-like protein/PAS domain S-box-containing protein